MSLLTIVQEVCGRLAIPVPTAVVGSSDTQVVQLLALTNKASHDLSQAAQWQALTAEKTFVTTATQAQANAIPADLDRFVPNSFYNRTTRRPLSGPVTPIQWQALLAMPSLATVYLIYRERQNQFLMTPTPAAGQTIAYEYVSANWAKSAGAVAQSSFLADTDTALIDEHLIADGVVWMFLRAHGFAYAEEMQTFERNLEQQIARDGSSSQLTLTPSVVDLNRVNLPDGNFGL